MISSSVARASAVRPSAAGSVRDPACQHEEIVVASRASSGSSLLQHGHCVARRPSLHYRNAFPEGDEIGQLVVWIVVLQHATQTRDPAR